MKPQFHLSEITTSDGLVHQGIFFRPKKSGKRALLWIHGLTGRFYGDVSMMETLAATCESYGFGFASFNNRGHDMITGAHKVDSSRPSGYSYAMIGAGNEVFEDSPLDIKAGVDFLVSEGYDEVVLVGISTGANKACYYGWKIRDTHVRGVALLSPISDRLSPQSHVPWYKTTFLRVLSLIGKGGSLLVGTDFFPGTPRRFLSLITRGSAEDIFDYGEHENPLARFSQITLPLCLLFAERDEHADRPMAEIKRIFDAKTGSKFYKSVIVPGAPHGFDGKEKEIARTLCKWVQAI